MKALAYATPFDASPLVSKSASINTEMVFRKIMRNGDPSSHGSILTDIASQVVAGRLHPIVSTRLDGLTAQNMRAAHEQVATKHTIGKIVIAV